MFHEIKQVGDVLHLRQVRRVAAGEAGDLFRHRGGTLPRQVVLVVVGKFLKLAEQELQV